MLCKGMHEYITRIVIEAVKEQSTLRQNDRDLNLDGRVKKGISGSDI